MVKDKGKPIPVGREVDLNRSEVHQGACSASRFIRGLVLGVGVFPVIVFVSQAWTAGFKPPWECQAYSGEAHLNCLYAYIEIQQDKISRLEKNLREQQMTAQELQSRVKQKELRVQALEREIDNGQETSRVRGYQFIRPYGGFYYRFGSPYYYDPYFGPPFGYSYGMYYPWW